MSALLSSTASKSLVTDKNILTSPSLFQDPKGDLAKYDQSADRSNGQAAAVPVGSHSDVSPLDPPVDLQPSLRLGFVGEEAETILSAREILERSDVTILVVDLTKAESEGRPLLAEMKSRHPDTLLIGMSASPTIASAVEAIRAGACDYLSKPFPLHVLERAFERVSMRQCFDAERRKLQEAVNSRSGMSHALGQSVEMEKLYQILSKVAKSRHPVTILGERGTGKELVARSIHSNSPDGSRPFVSVDIESMSSDALEDLLFGKAGSRRRGLLASPEGGSVFLNEIARLTPELQDRLAKTIKENRIWHRDGVVGQGLSVRILAASTLDLTQMVREGRFRMDLHRSLSLVNLRIPPLRGRPGDIAFLAERFLEKAGRAIGISRSLPQETLRLLETYDWPENTRELESAITQAFAFSSGE
jgi:DNA-binding NtrC family response regulator